MRDVTVPQLSSESYMGVSLTESRYTSRPRSASARQQSVATQTALRCEMQESHREKFGA